MTKVHCPKGSLAVSNGPSASVSIAAFKETVSLAMLAEVYVKRSIQQTMTVTCKTLPLSRPSEPITSQAESPRANADVPVLSAGVCLVLRSPLHLHT